MGKGAKGKKGVMLASRHCGPDHVPSGRSGKTSVTFDIGSIYKPVH